MKVLPVVLAILALPLAASAAPGVPEQFYGSVVYDSGSTPTGLAIVAYVGNTAVASSTTNSAGQYGVSPKLLLVADTEGSLAGTTITFTVAGKTVSQTATFTNAMLTKLDLSVAGAAPGSVPPTNSPSSGSSGGGGGGGGGSISTVVTAASVVSTTVQNKADANSDGKVDFLDFNALMVHWGQAGAHIIGDMNGDGVVDFLDFNMLMVNWTTI